MRGRAVFIVISFFLLTAFLSFKKGPSDELSEVYSLIVSSKLEEASKKLQELQRRYPGKREIKELYLILYLRKGQLEDARKIFQSFVGLFPFEHAIEIPPGKYAIVCDKRDERLYVIRGKRSGVELVAIFPCITGKREGDKLEEGDQRTPEGIYFATRWIDGKTLPPIYGYGAFELNYPNLLDRALRKDGYGIWIHGTNDPNRPPHSTNGCIAVRNEILRELKRYIKIKETPIVIVNGVKETTKEELEREKKELLKFIESWRRAWEESVKNLNRYFSFYSNRFISPRFSGKERWMEYKRRVTARKRYIRVKLENLYLTKDGRIFPFGHIYVASFKQTYRSNNYSSVDRKVLYIVKEGGSWKILGEEIL